MHSTCLLNKQKKNLTKLLNAHLLRDFNLTFRKISNIAGACFDWFPVSCEPLKKTGIKRLNLDLFLNDFIKILI